MKYYLIVVLIIISLLSFSQAPTNITKSNNGSISKGTIVLKQPEDSLIYRIHNKKVSERVIDSIIDVVIKETMMLMRNKGYIDTTINK